MFIIHGKENLDDILLLLSSEEAMELKDAIEQLLMSDNNHHVHINNDDYQKEITISILDKNSLETYHKDIRTIVESDAAK